MALLGKTLKGRTTRPGGSDRKRNIKLRQISRNQEEMDNHFVMQKQTKEAIRRKLEAEEKLRNKNRKQLALFWRETLRKAKTQTLKNEITVYQQNSLRELDSKEAFIQMLDKKLLEIYEQHQFALRNHIIHMDHLWDLQNSRLNGLAEVFNRDLNILETEFDMEREDMMRNQKNKVKELDIMIETVKEEFKIKTEFENDQHQSFREEIKSKHLDQTNTMKMILDSKQTKYYNELEQLHQKYLSETSKKTEEHTFYYKANKEMSITIDRLIRSIATKKSKIDLLKLKTLQHRQECSSKNQALKQERDIIAKMYQELKVKMLKFREEEHKRLTELVNNSKNAFQKLKEQEKLGQKILKLAELSRRLETEKEKVIPFYQSSVDEQSEIPQDLRNVFNDISPETLEEFGALNNFYKRYNKVLLDKLAIKQQKEQLFNDNKLLKGLLKQYLDGISINDDVINNKNPLLVINDKVNIQKLPVLEKPNITCLEGNQIFHNHQLQNGRLF